MKMRIKKYNRIGIIALILTLSLLPLSFAKNSSAQSTLEPELEYNSEIVNKSFSLFREYNNETSFLEEAGNYSNSYSYETDSYWGADGYYVEEYLRENFIEYDNSYNQTTSGYFEMFGEMDMYQVHITYGENLTVYVEALKNATFFMEINQTSSSTDCKIDQISHVKEYEIVKKYSDETRETLLSNNKTLKDEYDDIWKDNYTDNHSARFLTAEADFSSPIILTYQIFTTQDMGRVAWSEMMWQYFFYNDTNNDGFYTCNTNLYPTMYGKSEYMGSIFAYFYNDSFGRYPNDTLVEDAFSLIELTEPTLDDGKLQWSISYNNFPTYVQGPYYNTPYNINYEDVSKANYTYDFNFFANKTGAQLDLSSGMSSLEIEDESYYDAMKDMELTLPRFTYMVSSEKIEEEFSSVMSLGYETFSFESEGKKVAEIDMSEDKKPYVLYNRSDNDAPVMFDSIGASVSKFITSAMEDAITPLSRAPGDPFCNLVFTIENEIEDDPLIGKNATPSKIFTIETQNYPKWAGNGIYHDPSFKVYLADSPANGTPTGGTEEIGILNILGITNAIMIGVVLSIYITKKQLKE